MTHETSKEGVLALKTPEKRHFSVNKFWNNNFENLLELCIKFN